MKDIVSGLEFYAIKNYYGVYLKCDGCGDVLDAPVINDRISADEVKLVALAKELGWSGSMNRESSNDLCPKCRM